MNALRVVLFGFIGIAGAGAQMPASAPTGQAGTQDAGRARVYDLLQPSATTLLPLLDTLRVDKWKTSGQVKDAATNNIGSVRRDLQETLPPLLRDADAAPNSVTALLAVSRNVDALYDVVLRVADTAQIAAPEAQSADLSQALSALLVARRSVGDMLRKAVSAQEQKVTDLQKSLNEQTAAAAVVPPPCPPAPATTKKKAATKKPASSH